MLKKALDGVRVIELGLYIALPLATRMLASLGAEVIKVETLVSPDMMWFAPPYAPGAVQSDYRLLKRNITLDFRKPRGKEILEELVKKTDIFMTNLGGESLTKYGLGFDHIRSLKSDLIILWQTGLGGSGPYAGYKAYGRPMQHASGISMMTGTPETIYEVNVSYADYHTSMFDALAVLGALEWRRRTGQGCLIECPIYEAGVVTMGPAVLDYQANKVLPERRGCRHRYFAPHNVYPCRGEDSWCVIAVTDDREWAAFCDALGNPTWATWPQFATPAERVRNVEELDRLVAKWTSQCAAEEVMNIMQAAGVPAGVVAKGEDLAKSEHLRGHRFFREAKYYTPDLEKPGTRWSVGGTCLVFSEPLYLSKTPARFGQMHKVGQDNNYVYGELLGMSRKEIRKLQRAKILA